MFLALRVAGIGWYVAICVVLGFLLGLWVDDRVGSAPLFMITGILLGVLLAFYGIYRMVIPILNNAGLDGQEPRDN